MIHFTTTYCGHTQVRQHLPGVLGGRQTSPVWNRAKHTETGGNLTHLQTTQTGRWTAGGHLTRNPTQVRWDSAPKPHLSFLTARRQRQPRHLTPHASRGRVQTGSPTSDGVFVGAEEPWQQQQVEEVDQRQDVVAEQAGCKHRERRVDT